MRHRFALLLLLLPLLLSLACPAATVTFSTDYDFSKDPSCSATLTANCIDHFEYYTQGATAGTLGSLICKMTAPSGATTLTTAMLTTCNIANYGTTTLLAIPVARDSTGAATVQGPIASFSGTIKPGGIVGFSWK